MHFATLRPDWLAAALATLCMVIANPTYAAAPGRDHAQRLYREGILVNGAPLVGERAIGLMVEGQEAACANCHRRSGLGAIEGGVMVPPIAGRFLTSQALVPVGDAFVPHAQKFAANRPAYTDATLARAIRNGLAPDGRALNLLMPRYALDDATMHELIGYLQGLASEPVPGVGDTTLHFATIVTPDADRAARQGMLDVLTKFFAEKGVLIGGASRPLHTSHEFMYRVARKWQLHVWELTGSPETWGKQLDNRLAAEPVFAVVSGLAGATWAPVHAFCERAALPCLFPNVELPVVAEQDFYSVYFSRGVLLEADLVAKRLQANSKLSATRLVEVYRDGDVGAAAALALRGELGLTGSQVNLVNIEGEHADAKLAQALHDVVRTDTVVLWLRASDLRLLPEAPPQADALYISGTMAGLEQAPLPKSWRVAARLTYPVDLPQVRRVRMDFPNRWFKVAGIPLVADRVQVDTYLACIILAEALGHMQDSFVRDYLVERVENLISHRLVNGFYPRLGLGAGQRFASKGGYIVRFAASEGAEVIADGEWIVP
jgi:hypothetical protein